MELFDVYNEDGSKTGAVISREEAHEKGILHAAVHIYVCRVQCGALQILVQKRADDKDSFPSLWDTSCAGHVSSGDSFEYTVKKELSEELGIDISNTAPAHLFTDIVEKNNVFHGKPFHDREVYGVYALIYDAPAESIVFQKEEISAVKWIDAEALLDKLNSSDPEYCIMPGTYRRALRKIKELTAGSEGRAE